MITSSSSCLLGIAKIVPHVGWKWTRHPSRRSPVDVSFTGYNGWSYPVFLNFKRLPDLQEQGLYVHYGPWLCTCKLLCELKDETLAIGLYYPYGQGCSQDFFRGMHNFPNSVGNNCHPPPLLHQNRCDTGPQPKRLSWQKRQVLPAPKARTSRGFGGMLPRKNFET